MIRQCICYYCSSNNNGTCSHVLNPNVVNSYDSPGVSSSCSLTFDVVVVIFRLSLVAAAAAAAAAPTVGSRSWSA